MNKINNAFSPIAFPELVVFFYNSLAGGRQIRNKMENKSKLLARQQEPDAGSNYNHFRSWCKIQRAVL